jgi:DNA replication ATP-dependent helicase Dna2
LTPPEPAAAPFRLTGTRVAEFFRFGCERQLRYDLVAPGARDGSVPAPDPMPGQALLTAAGRRWERRVLRRLLARLGPERVASAGWTPAGNPVRLGAEEVVAVLRDPGPVEVLVQPELRLRDPGAFVARFGLPPGLVELAPAVPDLIRVRRPRRGPARFQVVDIRASGGARTSHFAQVAFYSLLLEELCRTEGIEAGRADPRWGRVWARDGRGPRRFALGAYRYHIERLLRETLPALLVGPADESAWHLSPRCSGCGHLRGCRAEADRTDDLARVPGITAAGKRALAGRGVRSVEGLLRQLHRPETFRGSGSLESQAPRLRQRVQALRYGKVFDIERHTHLMAPHEDVRVVLSAERDPVGGGCFALGLRVAGRVGAGAAPATAVWLAAGRGREEERAILHAFLDRLARLLEEVGGSGATLHVYLYEHADLRVLQELLTRRLRDGEPHPLLERLLRGLSPARGTAGLDAPGVPLGTIVRDVVETLFALPVAYGYDLTAVSERLRPAQGAAAFRPPGGYLLPFSSQLAWQRAHELWSLRLRPRPGAETAEALDARLRALVAEKLEATDSVVRAIRERAQRGGRLRMRKDPIPLRQGEPAIAEPILETLRVFAQMESAAEAVATRALHLLPAEERARRFESIRGLELVERRPDGVLAFEFDPACRDAKFRPGDFTLVLTNDDGAHLLEIDRAPWKRRRLMVELLGYDLSASPPRLLLSPGSGFRRAEESGEIDLNRRCVLDRAPADFQTRRLVRTLRGLATQSGEAAAVRAILGGGAPDGWRPRFDPAAVNATLMEDAAATYGRPVLNADQERAWRAAFGQPVTLVWGPPGTGKTYLLAWMLLGFAGAARSRGEPLRVLLTAATHRAVANVLQKLDRETRAAGLGSPLRMVKLVGSGSEADRELAGSRVELLPDERLEGVLAEAEERREPLVVGGTVWSLWKRMRRAAEAGEGEDAAPLRPWFDLVVIDEASQMKVAEAAIAMSAMRAGAQVILSGDDRQLAPVVRGRYARDAGSLFGSVFEHLARHHARLPLRESRRMNRVLVEYPRSLFYPGLFSADPEQRVRVAAPAAGAPDDALRELFLDPDDAVVLCTYRGAQGTARNAFEAGLAARLVALARRDLLDPATGEPFASERFVAEALAVISPHRAQNAAILAELHALGLQPAELPVVDTVERMQGNERQMIVVSYAVADREYAEAEAEFLLDPNRFNVAITRARAKLVVLVSQEVLDALPADEEVLAGSMALKGFVAHCADGVREVVLPGPDGGTVQVTCRYRRM